MDLDGDEHPYGHQVQVQLTPTNFEKLQEYVEFKDDFHHVLIRVQKDPEQKWQDLPYLATNVVIVAVLDCWLEDWHNPMDSKAGSSKTITQQEKE